MPNKNFLEEMGIKGMIENAFNAGYTMAIQDVLNKEVDTEAFRVGPMDRIRTIVKPKAEIFLIHVMKTLVE